MVSPSKLPESMSSNTSHAPQTTSPRDPISPTRYPISLDHTFNHLESRLLASQTEIVILASQLTLSVNDLRNAQRTVQEIRGALGTSEEDDSLLAQAQELIFKANRDELKVLDSLVQEAKQRLKRREDEREQDRQNTTRRISDVEKLRYGGSQTVRRRDSSISTADDSSQSSRSLHRSRRLSEGYGSEMIYTGLLDDPFVDFNPETFLQKFKIKSPFKEHSFMAYSGPIPTIAGDSKDNSQGGSNDGSYGRQENKSAGVGSEEIVYLERGSGAARLVDVEAGGSLAVEAGSKQEFSIGGWMTGGGTGGNGKETLVGREAATKSEAGKQFSPVMTPNARLVLDVLHSVRLLANGIHMQEIAANLGISLEDVNNAGMELLAKGFIYKTIDAETWAVREGWF